MIQRIQTIFLLIASAAGITEIFTPLIKASQISIEGVYQDGAANALENQGVWLSITLATLVSIIAIFLFKNRKLQKQLTLLAILLVVLAVGIAVYIFLPATRAVSEISKADVYPGLGAFMPVLALVALILAYRGIDKDDLIVKSMDRLR